MIRTTLCVFSCVMLMSGKVLSDDKLAQRNPDPQSVLAALGIKAWQIDLTIPQDKPYGLTVYSRPEHKPKYSVNGTTDFNVPGTPKTEKITVTVALQTIHDKTDGKPRYVLGLSIKDVIQWTCEIESPFSASAGWGSSGELKMDSKGRIVLAFSEGTNSLSAGRAVEDYSSVIYIELAPIESK